MGKDRILVWFRNDLRIRDNEILMRAWERAEEILPVYIFDPRHFAETAAGLQKTGPLRARFILESVADLRKSLGRLGGDLLIRFGEPEQILPELTEQYEIKEVYHHREVAQEETEVSMRVEEALWKQQINLRHFIGHTLYHKEDLPFPIRDIPDAFQTFRKKVERESSIRPCLGAPKEIRSPFLGEDAGDLPTPEDLGFSKEDFVKPGQPVAQGGESACLEAMKHFFDDPEPESGLSPWLALGCLSVHTFYHEIREQELRGFPKKIAAQLTLSLLWRDYYRFMFKKHGNRFFFQRGFSEQGAPVQVVPNEVFRNWVNGETGDELVDRLMKRLKERGFLTHKERLLVGVYLVHGLSVSHLLGAAYFEQQLIDYTPASNYGNWAHLAGVGSSARDNKEYDFKKLSLEIAV